jgi:hypothetical protein
MGKSTTPENLLENEWYHVRYSGEIPEVALHSSLFFLTDDPEGPGLKLGKEHIQYLHEAVLARYLEIVVRDITPENRDSSIYRGVLRTISNWRRMKRFCQRHDLSYETIRNEVSQGFVVFLEHQIQENKHGRARNSIDCSFDDLTSFALELGISIHHMEESLKPQCRELS